jgi:hypothetical protein
VPPKRASTASEVIRDGDKVNVNGRVQVHVQVNVDVSVPR